MPTYTPKASEITREWVVIDADGLVLGRLATEVARLLRGKHKPTFAPNADVGDHVIIINADKVVLTGRKRDQKIYYHHTGYIGGIKERTAGAIMAGKFPERILEKAVERMLPKESPLARLQMTHLRLFAGAAHDHEAQQPQTIDFKSMSAKNTRSV